MLNFTAHPCNDRIKAIISLFERMKHSTIFDSFMTIFEKNFLKKLILVELKISQKLLNKTIAQFLLNEYSANSKNLSKSTEK